MRLLAVVVGLLTSMDSKADWLLGKWKIDEAATREANIEWHEDFVWKQIRSSCLLSDQLEISSKRYILRNDCADVEWDTEYTTTPLGNNRLSIDLENKHSHTVWKTELGFCSHSNKLLTMGPNLEAIPMEKEDIPYGLQFNAEDQTRSCWIRD